MRSMEGTKREFNLIRTVSIGVSLDSDGHTDRQECRAAACKLPTPHEPEDSVPFALHLPPRWDVADCQTTHSSLSTSIGNIRHNLDVNKL